MSHSDTTVSDSQIPTYLQTLSSSETVNQTLNYLVNLLWLLIELTLFIEWWLILEGLTPIIKNQWLGAWWLCMIYKYNTEPPSLYTRTRFITPTRCNWKEITRGLQSVWELQILGMSCHGIEWFWYIRQMVHVHPTSFGYPIRNENPCRQTRSEIYSACTRYSFLNMSFVCVYM